ncbi:MAG: hypothetical protein QOE90_3477 [Thermoplasmata archaeon]|jgi:O-antigen/teichoic acid export membrane protein|nr:hypothetical protein [Thermoplasmata archaeon]
MAAPLSKRLLGTAVSLAAGTFVGSAMGFLFWTLLARHYPPEVVGLASAAIGVLGFFSTVGKWGFDIAILRYGHKDLPELLNASLAWATLISGLGAGAFLVLVPWITPSLVPLQRSFLAAASFVLAVVLTSWVPIISSAFLAVHKPFASFVQTSAAATLRVLLLLALLSLALEGAVMSWALAAAAATLISLLVTLPRVLPGYKVALRMRFPASKEIMTFAFWNNLVAVAEASPVLVLPPVLADTVGPAESGFFYVGLMIANLVWVVPTASATAVLNQGARGEGSRRVFARLLVGIIALLAVGMAALALLGRVGLRFFGVAYADHAYVPLLILSASSLPLTAIRLFGARCRIRNDTPALLAVNGVSSGLGVAVAGVASLRWGIVGAAWGWLAVQTITAAFLVLTRDILPDDATPPADYAEQVTIEAQADMAPR